MIQISKKHQLVFDHGIATYNGLLIGVYSGSIAGLPLRGTGADHVRVASSISFIGDALRFWNRDGTRCYPHMRARFSDSKGPVEIRHWRWRAWSWRSSARRLV